LSVALPEIAAQNTSSKKSKWGFWHWQPVGSGHSTRAPKFSQRAVNRLLSFRASYTAAAGPRAENLSVELNGWSDLGTLYQSLVKRYNKELS
jgi:hypothetical protein